MVDKTDIKDMRFDVNIGMFFSNFVMFFIILATGSVLFRGGITTINTVQDAASALKPLAGNSAYLLFAIGVIGTGLLAIPVLAGSVSYMIAETFDWKEGLNTKWHQAKRFYLVLAISIIIGFVINLIGINPIKALIFTAIAYGVTAPPLIAIILHICNNKKIMGEFTNGPLSNTLSWINAYSNDCSSSCIICNHVKQFCSSILYCKNEHRYSRSVVFGNTFFRPAQLQF